MAVQVKDIGNAIRIFYERFELSSKDIKELFGVTGSKTVSRLKKEALDYMKEAGKEPWSAGCVNTECAYEAWGLNIKDLERRYQKLNKIFGIKKEPPRNSSSEGSGSKSPNDQIYYIN